MPRRLQPNVYKRVVTSRGDVSAGKVAGSLVCAKSRRYQLRKKRRVALIDLRAQLVFFAVSNLSRRATNDSFERFCECALGIIA